MLCLQAERADFFSEKCGKKEGLEQEKSKDNAVRMDDGRRYVLRRGFGVFIADLRRSRLISFALFTVA